MTYEEIWAIRDSLDRTWNPFFSRFGRLLPVQVRAIPLILAGDNVVVQSPTASGKTEAVVAPLIERMLGSQRLKPTLLYIAPTRALIYDIYERLNSKMNYLGLKVAVRTGDRHQFRGDKPQDIVITTPESLDSMLCRDLDNLRNIRYVVLDELHLLDMNYRGDQTMLDLVRLNDAVGEPIQYCALSATLNDPLEVAGRYFTSPVAVSVPGRREILYELHQGLDPESVKKLLIKLRDEGFRKLLFFCNSRREVESLGLIIRDADVWPSNGVFVHHGSLSFKEREATEASVKRLKAVVCVSTMSLEVGVDIGDIDVVVLVRPPPSVSSLLQRIGRGNRRLGTTRSVGVYENHLEHSFFEAQFNEAIEGKIEKKPCGPCLSVAIQQVFSYVYQNRGHAVNRKKVSDLLSRLSIGEEDSRKILSKLGDDGYLHVSATDIHPTSKVLDLGERGFIHSNIPSTGEVKVIDAATGNLIGEVAAFENIDRSFVLSGKKWAVDSLTEKSIRVVQTPDSPSGLPRFTPRSHHGRYFYLLPRELAERCCSPIFEEV